MKRIPAFRITLWFDMPVAVADPAQMRLAKFMVNYGKTLKGSGISTDNA